MACTAPAGVAVALDVKAELARELVRPARLFDIELYFSSAVGVPQQDVTVSVHTHALRSHTLVMEFPAQTHAAACDTASRISRLFAQWQPGDGAGSLAERLGVTASDDMLPRVAALPEFLYAKVSRPTPYTPRPTPYTPSTPRPRASRLNVGFRERKSRRVQPGRGFSLLGETARSRRIDLTGRLSPDLVRPNVLCGLDVWSHYFYIANAPQTTQQNVRSKR